MTEPKHAFIVHNTSRVVTITNGEADRTPISKATAKARGYQIHAWPEDTIGIRVDTDDLPDHIPAPEAGLDPAIVAKFDRRIELRNSPEARAQPFAAELLLDNPMSLDMKRAFLRGLPATSTNIELNIEKDATAMQPGQTKAARLVEIKLGFLAERVNNNEPGAKALAAKVRSAALVAEARGEPLHVTLASLGIVL